MALASFSTILIFGGTSGIGESFARRFHALGKKVIITGRRQNLLDALAQELPGLETYALDNADIAALPGHARALLAKYPTIDTVWVNSGVGYPGSLRSLDGFSDDKIATEITTNLTAPIVLARHFIPHLLALPARDGGDSGSDDGKGKRAHFLITGSGLGFIPMGLFPAYCATKAAVHSFLVGLRETLADTHVGVVEVAAPYVRTEFDKAEPMDHLATPMELADFTDQVMAIFETTPSAELKEAAVGFAALGAGAWRAAFGKALEGRGSRG